MGLLLNVGERRVHYAIIVHHGHHKATGEGVAVDESKCGHGVGEETTPEGKEGLGKEVRVGDGGFIVEAVGVELEDRGGGDDDAGGEAVGNYVEGKEEGGVEGGREAVVRWRGEGEEVDLGGGLRADERAGVLGGWCGGDGRDLEDEEGLWLGHDGAGGV